MIGQITGCDEFLPVCYSNAVKRTDWMIHGAGSKGYLLVAQSLQRLLPSYTTSVLLCRIRLVELSWSPFTVFVLTVQSCMLIQSVCEFSLAAESAMLVTGTWKQNLRFHCLSAALFLPNVILHAGLPPLLARLGL
jgi:hypothetical protein